MEGHHSVLGIGIITTPPSPDVSGLTLDVQSGEGVRFPPTSFYATVCPPGVLSTLDNSEIVIVTNITSDTLTIQRAQYGTTAQAIDVGWIIYNGIYPNDFSTGYFDNVYMTDDGEMYIGADPSGLPYGGIIRIGSGDSDPTESVVAAGNFNIYVGRGQVTGIPAYFVVQDRGGNVAQFDLSTLGGTRTIQMPNADINLSDVASITSKVDNFSDQSIDGLKTFAKDVEVNDTAYGVVLRSPDNTRWRISVSNLGVISATSI